MVETCACSMKSEFKHLQEDIVEIKQTVKEDAKETTKEMMGMRDSKIRTEIALEAIKTAQDATNKTQVATLTAIQELKDAPRNDWKKMSFAWKVGIGMAVISYIVGNYLTYLKMFVK